MADDISIFLCKMVVGHEGLLSDVRVGRASHTTRKSLHVRSLSMSGALASRMHRYGIFALRKHTGLYPRNR